MRDAVERENKSPLIEQLQWQYSSFLLQDCVRIDDRQYSYFQFQRDAEESGFHVVKGVSRMAGSLLVQRDGDSVIVADVKKRCFVKVNEEDLSGVKHNEIVDLVVEGSRWEGDVLNDKPCGWGVLFDGSNRIVYEGFRVGEVNVCYGRQYYPDVGVIEYEGDLCEGLRWGRGAQYNRNGVTLTDGEWLDGEHVEKIVVLSEDSAWLHNHIEELIVGDNCCNGEEWKELDLRCFFLLRELTVGNQCFKNVEVFKCRQLSALERVEVGANSFTLSVVQEDDLSDSNRFFFLDSCPKLRELKIGPFSFVDYALCEIENVDALEVIQIGELELNSRNFESVSLELRSGRLHNE